MKTNIKDVIANALNKLKTQSQNLEAQSRANPEVNPFMAAQVGYADPALADVYQKYTKAQTLSSAEKKMLNDRSIQAAVDMAQMTGGIRNVSGPEAAALKNLVKQGLANIDKRGYVKVSDGINSIIKGKLPIGESNIVAEKVTSIAPNQQYIQAQRMVNNLSEADLYKQSGMNLKPTWEEFRKMTPQQKDAIAKIREKMMGIIEKPATKPDIYGGLGGETISRIY